jgi:hypothetical protein
VIAFVGPLIPLEVLAATGRSAGPLTADFDAPTPHAERWLESKFAPWAPSLLECWASGAYDAIETVVFSRADDTAQRLYYYVCELQRRGELRGPQPEIFDLAQIPRQSSLDRTIAQVWALAERLGVGEPALAEAVDAANQLRSTAPSRPVGAACLLAGTAAPDNRFREAVAQSGFVPVGHTLAQDWSDPGPLVEPAGDHPATALGRQLHARAGGPRSFADPAALLATQLREAAASAVVLWRIEEDEAHAWHLPAERRALAETGLPHLVMTRRDWLARDGALHEVQAFLDGVKG